MNSFENNGDILNYINILLGKDNLGRYISPEEYTQLANESQLELLNSKINIYEANRDVTMDLSEFTKTAGDNVYPPLTLDAYGKTPFPADCVYTARANYLQYLNVGCSATSRYRQVVFVPQDYFGGAMDMPMMNPLSNPNETPAYAVVESEEIRVVPNVGKISLNYIRFPESINYDYEEINGEPVYLPPGTYHTDGTPSTSVEPEWRRSVWPELADLIYKKAAINIRSEFNLKVQ